MFLGLSKKKLDKYIQRKNPKNAKMAEQFVLIKETKMLQ